MELRHSAQKYVKYFHTHCSGPDQLQQETKQRGTQPLTARTHARTHTHTHTHTHKRTDTHI